MTDLLTTTDPLAAGLLGRTGAGTFSIEIGPRLRDRLFARAAGHRRTGAVPVALAIEHRSGGQRWVRSIDGRDVTTTLRWRDGVLRERLGPLTLRFAPATTPDGITLRSTRATLAGVPLPRRSVPAITCATTPADGGLAVQVEIRSPQGRRILTYGGTLT